MEKSPVIMTFINSKGGVGKTTLCVLMANYLAMRGASVLVIDVDPQQSIAKLRSADLKKYGDDYTLYHVTSCTVQTKEEMASLISRILKSEQYDVVAFDTPGTLITDRSLPLLYNTNVFIVPYHYDASTIRATFQTALQLKHIRSRMKGKVENELFFVPNRINSSIGTKEELKLWNDTRACLSEIGCVIKDIRDAANLERISSICAIDLQLDIVEPIFSTIYQYVFATDEDLKPVTLRGIQSFRNTSYKKLASRKRRRVNKATDMTDSADKVIEDNDDILPPESRIPPEVLVDKD